jgi:isoleucyl-tRNA synthetase
MSETTSTLGAAIKVAQERLRTDKRIGSSLESAATVYLPASNAEKLYAEFSACLQPSAPKATDIETQLAGLFVISEVNLRTLSDSSAPANSVFTTEDPDAIKQQSQWCEEEVLSGDSEVLSKARVLVHPPSREKCPRCWRFVKEDKEEVCGRCGDVVSQQDRV